jgi:hypothetical protein
MDLRDAKTQRVDVQWIVADQRVRDAWANKTDTTEAGAYAMVLAGVEVARGHVALRRAETGTGADYYVGPPSASTEDLENCFRLEISGVDSGDQAILEQRLTEKVDQASNGKGALPAIAGVVGFRIGWLLFADVLEPA